MRSQKVESFVCLGDVAMDGPQPTECVRLVRELGCPVVRGNADREMLEAPFAFVERGFPDEREIYEIGQWSATQLTEAERGFLSNYQSTVLLPDLLCFHGSPASDSEVLDAETPSRRLEELREQAPAKPVWIGGHTHKPLLRTLEGWTLLNPGSVGLPYEKRGEVYVNLAYAEYLLLDKLEGGWQPTFRRVFYDVQDIQTAVMQSGMPHAHWVAGSWVQG